MGREGGVSPHDSDIRIDKIIIDRYTMYVYWYEVLYQTDLYPPLA